MPFLGRKDLPSVLHVLLATTLDHGHVPYVRLPLSTQKLQVAQDAEGRMLSEWRPGLDHSSPCLGMCIKPKGPPVYTR